ncbi:hypothetical protein F5H01DRAFT_349819 [Linnemannia elongata]|nr:hypothetical protein F5H01DRAFT_349819 [Linnemannia elongata]
MLVQVNKASQRARRTRCREERKSRHLRIKKQRRYERLAATRQLSSCTATRFFRRPSPFFQPTSIHPIFCSSSLSFFLHPHLFFLTFLFSASPFIFFFTPLPFSTPFFILFSRPSPFFHPFLFFSLLIY